MKTTGELIRELQDKLLEQEDQIRKLKEKQLDDSGTIRSLIDYLNLSWIYPKHLEK